MRLYLVALKRRATLILIVPLLCMQMIYMFNRLGQTNAVKRGLFKENYLWKNMATVETLDMDVIKEIPGYKVILKAVLKSQIQQLVDQLSVHTKEESLILTASVADGTLSHFGSDSGKCFLKDKEDVKSQFLGFCLKWCHDRKMEKETEEAMPVVENATTNYLTHRLPCNQLPQQPSWRQQSPKFSNIRSQQMKFSKKRHQPYPVSKPVRVLQPKVIKSKLSPTNTNIVESIKIEDSADDDDDDDTNDVHRESESELNVQSVQNKSSESLQTFEKHLDNKDDKTYAETSTELHLDSDLSNLISSRQSSCDNLYPNVTVKVEALPESEITTNELLEHGPQSTWTSNTSAQINSDPSVAIGNQSDGQLFQQGYKIKIEQEDASKRIPEYSYSLAKKRGTYSTYTPEDRAEIANFCMEHGPSATIKKFLGKFPNLKLSTARTMRDRYFAGIYGAAAVPIRSVNYAPNYYPCEFCEKVFPGRAVLERHRRIHTGERPYQCTICGKGFAQKGAMNSHQFVHMKDIL